MENPISKPRRQLSRHTWPEIRSLEVCDRETADPKQPPEGAEREQPGRGRPGGPRESPPGDRDPQIEGRGREHDKGSPTSEAQYPMDLANDAGRVRDVRQHENAGRRREAFVTEREPFPDPEERRLKPAAPHRRIDANDRPTSSFEGFKIFSVAAPDVEDPSRGRADQRVRETAVPRVQVSVEIESDRRLSVTVHLGHNPTARITATETMA